MDRRTILIIAVVAVLAICLCVVCSGGALAFVFGMTAPIVEVGDAYFNAWQAGDTNAAYGLLHPDLQALTSPEDLGANWGDVRPVKWTYTTRTFENNDGTLKGTMTDENGDKWSFEMSLLKEGDTWLITDISYY